MKQQTTFKRIITSTSLALLAMIGGAFLFNRPATAAPNIGPDPANISYTNYYGASYSSSIPRSFLYVVARNPYADIVTTRLKVYMPSSSGTITIKDPHMCTYRNATYSSPYSYYTSGDVVYTTGSGNVTRYRMSNTAGSATTLNGNWDSSTSCENKTLSFSVSGSTLDPNTGLYPYFLEVTALANGQYSNLYGVNGPAGAYISQDAAQAAQSFALHQNAPVPTISNPDTPTPPDPFRNYSNWELPFGPDCTVTAPVTRDYVELYDDDNYQNYEAQGQPFWVQMREYDRSGNFLGTIRPYGVRWTDWWGDWGSTYTSPTTDSEGGWLLRTYNSSTYDYVYDTTDKQSIRVYYDFKKDRIYRFFMFNVFYYNKVMLQLPWESVYYYRPCTQDLATVRPSSTVDKATMTYPDTATFTHYLNVTNFSASGSANYSIQRYRNGVAVGSPQTGSTLFNGNGQYTIRTNAFNSTPADLGARICERLTLSDPGSGLTINNNPSEACTTVTARPYIEVGNNDVWAGGRFDYNSNLCTGQSPRSPAISSWVQTGSGANGEYGVFGLGGITEFGSGRSPGGTGLTFANTPTNGNLGAPTRCITNYYSTIGTTGGVAWPGMASIPANGGKLKYTSTGNLTINGGTVPAGTQAVLLVNGNVTITGNINYANSYGSQSAISALWIVATGNIYIQENVTNISGLYIAQGTSSTPGRIHTCTQTGQTTTYNPMKTTTCNNGLEVYGALIADKIFWQRTRGTAASGQPSAESIQFAPELYLANPTSTTSSTGGVETQDLKELPPIY